MNMQLITEIITDPTLADGIRSVLGEIVQKNAERKVLHDRITADIQRVLDAGGVPDYVAISADLEDMLRLLVRTSKGIVRVDESLPPDTITCRAKLDDKPA